MFCVLLLWLFLKSILLLNQYSSFRSIAKDREEVSGKFVNCFHAEDLVLDKNISVCYIQLDAPPQE